MSSLYQQVEWDRNDLLNGRGRVCVSGCKSRVDQRRYGTKESGHRQRVFWASRCGRDYLPATYVPTWNTVESYIRKFGEYVVI